VMPCRSRTRLIEHATRTKRPAMRVQQVLEVSGRSLVQAKVNDKPHGSW
jgi:hypothetical protein